MDHAEARAGLREETRGDLRVQGEGRHGLPRGQAEGRDCHDGLQPLAGPRGRGSLEDEDVGADQGGGFEVKSAFSFSCKHVSDPPERPLKPPKRPEVCEGDYDVCRDVVVETCIHNNNKAPHNKQHIATAATAEQEGRLRL